MSELNVTVVQRNILSVYLFIFMDSMNAELHQPNLHIDAHIKVGH